MSDETRDPLAEIRAVVENVVDWAYQTGYHEHGYQIVPALVDAARAEAVAVVRRYVVAFDEVRRVGRTTGRMGLEAGPLEDLYKAEDALRALDAEAA